jgi:hypothetical protein
MPTLTKTSSTAQSNVVGLMALSSFHAHPDLQPLLARRRSGHPGRAAL